MTKFLKLTICLCASVLSVSCAKDVVELTGDIEGTVKDISGTLIENCTVALSPGGKSTFTDAQGSFSFENLDAGTYTLTFAKAEYADKTQEVSVVTGQISRVNVVLEVSSSTKGIITGTIKDYENGQLISNCNISLSPGGTSKTSSSSGAYEFTDLAPGEYSLTFSKAGYYDANKSVKVVAGQTSTVDVLLNAKSSFVLSDNNYDFGDLEVSKTFYFFNNSDESCSFSIPDTPDWLSFSQTSGSIKASGNVAVTASVNRDAVSEGSYTQNVIISYSGKSSGTVALSIKMKKVVLSAPTVSIAGAAENIKQNSFDIGGSITATGGSEITGYGHCWNTAGNPTIESDRTDLGNTRDIASFKSSVENLNTNTTYYVRAYAKNALGVSYSEQVAVTTQDISTDKWDGNIASSFEGGSGSSVDPYLVKTGGQLLLMKNYSSKYFKLTGNIDLNNNNWLPFEFEGSLDGAGYMICNLRISRKNDQQGLFSELYGIVKNLTVSGIDIQAPEHSDIGAIAGYMRGGSIRNCKIILNANSVIKGSSCVGGVVGSAGYMYGESALSVSGCSVDGVSGAAIIGSSRVGGIVGAMDHSSTSKFLIESCRVSVNIAGGTDIGGICGAVWGHPSDQISYCSYRGSISGDGYAGGIYGADNNIYNSDGWSVISCRSDANISISGNYAGGIYGSTKRISVIASYSSGTIVCEDSNAKYIGGIGGYTDSDYDGCNLCYSTVTSSCAYFGGISGKSYLHAQDCASVSQDMNATLTNCDTSCRDIATFLKECYSQYASYYDFGSIWNWTGSVNGVPATVPCPKLSWE